ncbi:MAG: N-acetylneuraminate synthase [Flavobacteriales bacterium]
MTPHTLIIAEAGVNHNGDPDLALQLVDTAADAGADIVKFQTFKAGLSIAADAPKADYQRATTGGHEGQLEMVRRLELDGATHEVLIRHCGKRGIGFLSTPFDTDSIDLLRRKGVTTGKIPSGEVTNKPYLQAMARTFPHLIMSTGMCTLEEVAAALDVLHQAGARPDAITLLHCNTGYPTPVEDVHLRAMATLRERFGIPVGYSDHTQGITIPVAAVAMGACVIEKHITLDRTLPGPDQAASLEPGELKAMVKAIREVEMALGRPMKQPSPSESVNIAIARKSIHAAVDIPKGTIITAAHLIMLRPGTGLSPMLVDEVIGKTAARDLAKGTRPGMDDLR